MNPETHPRMATMQLDGGSRVLTKPREGLQLRLSEGTLEGGDWAYKILK